MSKKFNVTALLSIVFLFLYTGNSYAAITPITNDSSIWSWQDTEVDFDSSIWSGQDTEVDFLTIAPPNEFGVSFNNFSYFGFNVRPLKIINTHRRVRTSNYSTSGSIFEEINVEPAQLIIIKSKNIRLGGNLEIVGAPSDVLFIAPHSHGSIKCLNCSIDNALRVSMVTGTPVVPITGNSNEIGDIRTDLHSLINIKNMSAPGILSLDVLTSDLSLSGFINTHQKASKTISGAYKADNSGIYSIGTGSVNLILDEVTWDYEKNEIAGIERNRGATHVLGGKIKSSGIKISAVGGLEVLTEADTRTDILSAVSYKNGTHITSEGIDIQSLQGKLSVGGSLQSSGKINLKSMGSMLLLDEPVPDDPFPDNSIRADVVDIIAGGKIDNQKKIQSRLLRAAGQHIYNEGKLLVDDEINLWSQRQLANHFGGVIKSKTVRMESQYNIVRNGSRAAYRRSYIKDMTGRNVSDVEFENNGRFIRNIDNYVEAMNPSYLGTIYNFHGSQPVSSTPARYKLLNSYVKQDDVSARIVAERLLVKSVGFENINPYFVKINEQGEFNYKDRFSDQVSISVEDYIGIDSSEYFVNSSAKFFVNNHDSLLEVNTGLFLNERYRTVSLFDADHGCTRPVVAQDGRDACMRGSDYYIDIASKRSGNSPPGIIAALGNVNIKSTKGFINNTAYTEIYGDTNIDSPTINIFGLEKESVFIDHDVSTKTTSTVCFRSSVGWVYLSYSSGIPKVVSCPPHLLTTTRIVNTSTASVSEQIEYDSLFLSHGTFKANASLAWFKNHSPVDGLIGNVIEDLVYETRPEALEGYYNTSGSWIPQNADIYISSVEEVKNSGTIKIGEALYYLYDELKKILTRLADRITRFFLDIDWFE